jgi:hypothetical protein
MSFCFVASQMLSETEDGVTINVALLKRHKQQRVQNKRALAFGNGPHF